MDESDPNVFSPLEGENRQKLFKALESETRLEILRLLLDGEKYIQELARLLDVSAPFVAKNVKILEDADLVTRNIYGNTHVLNINENNIYSALDLFGVIKEIDRQNDKCMMNGLKKLIASEAKEIQNNKTPKK
ncbi:helix-turn-helix transcriptional regulator [Methanolobus vulcani]|uniref:Winged helix-turn-helix transcriptional regulator n=1 Tax=Methanolobus vulcani TaxID=38026 RepID=A0A7Z8KQ54_9EURY|nr:winged helix-turn-helix domain-containing protein [Methanolobus vulcani]TQD25912.1 winged helix-turn-helix transcriptional regulator [Methanolobus vulcani]